MTHGERGVGIFREREEEAYRGSSYIIIKGMRLMCYNMFYRSRAREGICHTASSMIT